MQIESLILLHSITIPAWVWTEAHLGCSSVNEMEGPGDTLIFILLREMKMQPEFLVPKNEKCLRMASGGTRLFSGGEGERKEK